MSDRNPTPVVAVIDIGSNSIKSLVAARGIDGRVQLLDAHTVEARISAGISRARPRLSDAGIGSGVAAIEELLGRAAPYSPARTVLIATSAVRDAENGADFCARVVAATGHAIRILTGEEEANLIGRGLTCDPALSALRDFYVFDLGGGSLECLAFRDRKIEQAVSLQLGCVRLTEKFVPDPSAPLPPQVVEAIDAHTSAVLAASDFRFTLPASAPAVGTGGTITTVRAMLGASAGLAFEATEPTVTRTELRELLARLGAMPLSRRREVEGLPRGRADIFPAALSTLIRVAEFGGFHAYQNSLYNLRYGLADETLGG